MTLRARLILAFLALALVPIALLTLFALDRLGRSIDLWNTRGVDRALESALEVSKSSIARMEATVLAQAEECSLGFPRDSLTATARTALRHALRAGGLDFAQLYRHVDRHWILAEEVLPEAVLGVAPVELADELQGALASDRIVRSAHGALAGVASLDSQRVLAVGMRVYPGFFAEVKRIGEGVGFYRRFAVVRDVSRIYLLLLVAALALALTAVAVWVAGRLASGMTRPLRDLEVALERVARGELETRVIPAGARELRALGESFNAMTARLQAARAALTEAEREAVWREVARRLAHEFKNILTPISLSVHRLRRRAALVPEAEREAVTTSLDAITQGAEDLGRLAEQFSQFARLPEPRFERVDLAAIAQAAARLHESDRWRIAVTPSARPVWVSADRMLLSRAVHNLLLNSCEASPPGAEVELRLGVEGGQAVLEVLDRGHGISPEIRDRLFEPYTSTRSRGSGLGLSLVRDIVLQHGGSVTLDNREDGGARARLCLPLLEEAGPSAGSP